LIALALVSVVFLVVFSGAVVGLRLGRSLPDHHRADHSRDAVKLALGVVATLSALVLGLLVASAKDTFTEKEQVVKSVAAKISLLDRTMAEYGPDTAPARAELRRLLEKVLTAVWPTSGELPSLQSEIEIGRNLEEIQRRLLALTPGSKSQEWYLSHSLQYLEDIIQARLLFISQISTAMHPIYLIMLVLWLTFIFTGFGVISPRNALSTVALCVGAISVSGAILLVVEMDRAPFSTLITINRAPLDVALDHLGQ